MQTINFFNEKGNANPKIRTAMKEQTLDKVLNVLEQDNLDVYTNNDGGFSLCLAEDVSGAPIYAHFTFVVSTKDPNALRTEKAKAVVVSEDVVSLFE